MVGMMFHIEREREREREREPKHCVHESYALPTELIGRLMKGV